MKTLASVGGSGRPALICTLAPHHHRHPHYHPISGGEGLPEHRRAGLSLVLVSMATNGRGGELWADGVQGLGQGTGEGRGRGELRGGGGGEGSIPRVLCAWNNMSSWPARANG